MPEVNLPSPSFGKTDAETIQNLFDTVIKLRKELEFLMYNLDERNVLKAKRAEIAELYAGTIEANKITVVDAKITNAQIGSLEANKITTVTAKIGTAQIDTLTVGGNVGSGTAVVQGTFYNRTKITTEDGIQVFDNQVIPVDRVKIGQLDTNIYGIILKNANGDIVLAQDTDGNITIVSADGDVTISPTGIVINNGKISIQNKDGTATIIDAYGIDPRFYDYFKNLVYNSSFEVFDSGNVPLYWVGDGVVDANSNFHGSYSLKLTAGQYMMQTDGGAINPDWYDRDITRISFHRKLGQVKVQVYDETNDTYFTLTDEDGNTGLYITTARTTNWQGSRVSVSFDPNETGHASCVAFKLKFTNVHVSETSYIDAVMVAPDFTGKWSQLYKDGPKSYPAYIVNIHGSEEVKIWTGTEGEYTAISTPEDGTLYFCTAT